MKGFILNFNDYTIYGGADSGIANVLISNKEFHYCLNFGGMNADNVAYTWCRKHLRQGDKILISYEEFDANSPIIKLGNLPTLEDDLALLKEYELLKREMIEEGLLPVDYKVP